MANDGIDNPAKKNSATVSWRSKNRCGLRVASLRCMHEPPKGLCQDGALNRKDHEGEGEGGEVGGERPMKVVAPRDHADRLPLIDAEPGQSSCLEVLCTTSCSVGHKRNGEQVQRARAQERPQLARI